MARMNGNQVLHRSLMRRARALLRRDKVQFIDLSPVYQALRKLNSKLSSQMAAVCSVDEQIISDHVGVREGWAEYTEQLYQLDPPSVNLDASDIIIPVPDPPIREEPPTLTEVGMAISKLKCGKAAGICDIPAELLKAGVNLWLGACK